MDLLKAYESRAQFNSYSEDDLPSSFSDTFAAATTLQVREENSNSASEAYRVPAEAREVRWTSRDRQTLRDRRDPGPRAGPDPGRNGPDRRAGPACSRLAPSLAP